MQITFLSIDELRNVPQRTILVLKRAGITDVEEILSLAPHELYNTRGIGPKGYTDIINAIEKLNINMDRYKYYLSNISKNIRCGNKEKYPFNLLCDISKRDINELSENYKQILDYLIGTLSPIEKKIIEMRYVDYHTQNDIANLLNKAIGEVCKIQKRAVSKLKETARSKYLFIDNAHSLDVLEGTYIISLGLDYKLEKQLTDSGYETLKDIIDYLPKIKGQLKSYYYYSKLIEHLQKYGVEV